MTFDHESEFNDLKKFYRDEIRRYALQIGYRELSERLGHAENFISAVLKRDAFSALRRLYLEIMEGMK